MNLERDVTGSAMDGRRRSAERPAPSPGAVAQTVLTVLAPGTRTPSYVVRAWEPEQPHW